VARSLNGRQNLVVEFVGLPGVGKSHAARLVVARLEAVGITVSSSALRVNHELGTLRRVLYKLAIGAGEMVRHPTAPVRVGHALIRSRQQSPFDVARLSYNWFFLVGLLRRVRARPGVELLDEGTVQQLWSIAFAGGEDVIRDCSTELLRASPTARPLPDVVVLVEAPIGLVESRVEARRSRAGRLDRMEVAERQSALVRGTRLFGELLADDGGPLSRSPAPRLRRIRNADEREFGAEIDALVDELVMHVTAQPENARVGPGRSGHTSR
jgi:thymidylate kinase